VEIKTAYRLELGLYLSFGDLVNKVICDAVIHGKSIKSESTSCAPGSDGKNLRLDDSLQSTLNFSKTVSMFFFLNKEYISCCAGN